jgi:hypothetical protein
LIQRAGVGKQAVTMPDRQLRLLFDPAPPPGYESCFAPYAWSRSTLREAILAGLPNANFNQVPTYLAAGSKLEPQNWKNALPGLWGKCSKEQFTNYKLGLPLRLDRQLQLYLAGLALVRAKKGDETAYRDAYRPYLAIYQIAGFSVITWNRLSAEHGGILEESLQRDMVVLEDMARGFAVTYPTAFRVQAALKQRNAAVGAIFPLEDRPAGEKRPARQERLVPL